MKKNWYQLINIFLPFTVLLAFSVLFLVSPKQKISVGEKRKLAALPGLTWRSWTDGSFAKNTEDYLADHFVQRDRFIACSDFIKNHYGVSRKPEEGKYILLKKKKPAKPKSNKIKLNIDSNYVIPDDSAAELVLTNGVFIYDSCSYQFFGGNQYSAARYANMYNAVVDHLPKNIKYYCVLVPSSTEFNLPPAKYRSKSTSETKGIADVHSRLKPEIKKADVYSHMLARRKEYMFFKTDHHWTARGAYYAYMAFSEIADFQALTIQQLKPHFIGSPFLGSMYQMTHDPTLQGNPDRLEIFDIPFGNAQASFKMSAAEKSWSKGYIVYKNAQFGTGYGVFLGLDYPIMKIDGPNKNGRKLFILKESYANAFVPFLVPHFEQIFVADVRYFPYKIDQFIAEHKINEFLMMNQLVMANNPYTAQKVLGMLKSK